MKLHDASVEELEQELEIRKKEQKIPKMLPEDEVKNNLYDFLKEGVAEDIEMKIKDGQYAKDTETFTWESVIQAFYGEDIFDILN